MTTIARETAATVLIAGDDSLLRAGLRAMFASYPYLKVVGDVGNTDEALRLARTLVPDLVLLDINMRELDGIAVTAALGRALPRPVSSYSPLPRMSSCSVTRCGPAPAGTSSRARVSQS